MAGRRSLARAGAVLEVLFAFGLMHLGFRAFKRYTELGRLELETGFNVSPGAIMAAVGVLFVLARRRPLAAAGLRDAKPAANVAIGIAAVFALFAAGAPLVLAGMPQRPREIGPIDGAVYALAGVVLGLFLLWSLAKWAPRFERISLRASLGALALLLALPFAAGALGDVSLGYVLPTVAWRFFCAGFGEEVFFRGYVQSRLDEAFGTPLELWGTRFGAGLVLASLLFGLVHLINPCDYLGGSCSLAWGHALATAATPYGFLRARTGSVLAPAIAHGLLDVLIVVPALAAGD